MSWFSLVTTSCCLVLSILKLRSSGCVYVADQLALKLGLTSAVVLVVVCLLLLSVAVKLPPPHGRFCERPPLYVVVAVDDAGADRRAGNRRRGRVGLRLLGDGRDERRSVHRSQAGQREVEGLRVQALNGDVEVAIQRELDRVVERQRARPDGLPDRPRSGQRGASSRSSVRRPRERPPRESARKCVPR